MTGSRQLSRSPPLVAVLVPLLSLREELPRRQAAPLGEVTDRQPVVHGSRMRLARTSSSSVGVSGDHVHAAPKPRRRSRVLPTEHFERPVDGERWHPAGIGRVGIGDPCIPAAQQVRAVVQAEMILYVALDPAIASRAKKGEFVTCLDHFELLQCAIN